MATVYPTATGVWSTRTWNNDATGAAYGMAPQAGDTVLANGRTITIDQNITVAALSTRVGTTAAAGGGFTVSGTRTINADSYGGTTTCLTLSASTSAVQNGNSYGSNTSNSMYGTNINPGCVQNGNSTGGNGTGRTGTLLNGGGIQNGNSTGGSAAYAYGTQANGGIQNGNSTGGSASDAYGTYLAASGAIQYGNCTGGGVSGAHGTLIGGGCSAILDTATGATAGAYGIYSYETIRHYVLIKTESGSYAKSLNGSAETVDTNIPMVNYNTGGGGGVRLVNTRGGADQ